MWLFKLLHSGHEALTESLSAGQYLQPHKRQHPPLLNSSFNSASTFGWWNLWGCNFETLQSPQQLHRYPSPALCSWSCTPHEPLIFPSLCSHVRGCSIEQVKLPITLVPRDFLRTRIISLAQSCSLVPHTETPAKTAAKGWHLLERFCHQLSCCHVLEHHV